MTARRLLRPLAAWGAMMLALTGAVPSPTPAPTPFTYLLPAPKEAVVFAPFLLAEADGRYAREGLAVRFDRIAGGGAKVGEALGQGTGDAGGALGDTALILRARGVPVRGVALLGRHSFLTLMSRHGLAIDGPTLRGKAIGVPALKDVSFYALKAMLKQLGLTEADVTVRVAPAAELIAGLGSGELQLVVGTVDWGVQAERAGVALDYRPLDAFYPALAQAVMASDAAVAGRGEALARFNRATLAAIDSLSRAPDRAARRYVALAPQSGFSEAEVARIFRLLARNVYGASPGRFDARRMTQAANAAAGEGLVPAGTSASNSYTNQFVRR